jgi:hypothetical protein
MMNAPQAGQNIWRNVLSRVSGSSSHDNTVVGSIGDSSQLKTAQVNICTFKAIRADGQAEKREKLTRLQKNELREKIVNEKHPWKSNR